MHGSEDILDNESCCPLKIAKVIRKVRGGSQASLIEVAGGRRYVLKWCRNPQGPRVVSNEAIATGLYDRLGLPVPGWDAIEVSEEFIGDHRCMWFEEPQGMKRPRGGVHFGSSLLGACGEGVFEILPRVWYPRVANREDFIGAFVVDVWAEHADRRQALFLEDPKTRALSAVFIDHGHMFGGTGGDAKGSTDGCVYLDKLIYEDLIQEDLVEFWCERIRQTGMDAATDAVSHMHASWRGPADEARLARLRERLAGLESLVRSAVKNLASRPCVEVPFPGYNWQVNAVLQRAV